MSIPTPTAPDRAAQAVQGEQGEQGGAMETLAGFAAYAAAMEQSGAPILGHLVLYSVFETEVTRDRLHLWFTELGLDDTFLPPPIRQVDAFEQITGPRGVRATYQLTATPDADAGPRPRRRRRGDEKVTEVTLMMRNVSRDNLKLVRHLVREVRDEGAAELSYDPKMAEIVFWRDPLGSGTPGVGVLQIHPDEAAIAQLSESEQMKVRNTLDEAKQMYLRACTYYTSDRLRSVLRTYVEGLNAVKVRTSGGVYFVHRAHEAPLAALRELVSRLGNGSHLARVPLPDQEEMREMVVTAITTKTREELEDLVVDIATARRDGASEAKVEGLVKRFKAMQRSMAEHEELLGGSLDSTREAFKLVNAQVTSLLATAW
ncbi:DUF6744 family protein [Planotetraspora sp. GP83]|uniref:DUF6744 family protein n=1 Tax=Planotetraspora sp. GP83 TaxID=3156264 RepID=UPI00351404D2